MVLIREFTKDEWQLLRAIRLDALKSNADVFMDSHDNAAKREATHWIDMITDESCAIFGLFNGDKVIGITSIFTWKGDDCGKTAILAMSFIKAAYRGQGLSRMLYEARINWAKKNGSFEKIRVSHREGNEASRRANQAFDFELTDVDMTTWPDDTKAKEYIYELRL